MDDVTFHTRELPADLNDLSALIDRQIRLLLNGHSDGRELFRGLYGDATDEPIPARLRSLLRH